MAGINGGDRALEVLSQMGSHQHAEGKWAQASARIYIEPQMDGDFKVPMQK